MPNYGQRSKCAQIRVDTLMEDKLAYLQALTQRGGFKRPSITAVVRYCIDHVVSNVDDLVEENDTDLLHWLATSINKRHPPESSQFTKTPSFDGSKSYRALSSAAVRNRFNEALNNLADGRCD